MTKNAVFQNDEELKRLAVQNRLLADYERPVLEKLLSGRRGLNVLDIGCNDGSKTAARFCRESVSLVVGLEYNAGLADSAGQTYKDDDRLAFYCCDVESAGFADTLKSLTKQNGIAAYDIVYMSFVLMHLKDPAALLSALRGCLSPHGRLMIVEPNDGASVLTPDESGLLRGFLDVLRLDPFSGDRDCAAKLPALLKQCGYAQITVESGRITARQREAQKKSGIIDTFLSYLPCDISGLLEIEPENAGYKSCAKWLEQHYERLCELILQKDSSISMGVSIITCTGEKPKGRETADLS